MDAAKVDWQRAFFDLIDMVSFADHSGDVGDGVLYCLRKHLGIKTEDLVDEVGELYLEDWRWCVYYNLHLKGYKNSNGEDFWTEELYQELLEEQNGDY